MVFSLVIARAKMENPDVHLFSLNVIKMRLMLSHHFVFRRKMNFIDEMKYTKGWEASKAAEVVT